VIPLPKPPGILCFALFVLFNNADRQRNGGGAPFAFTPRSQIESSCSTSRYFYFSREPLRLSAGAGPDTFENLVLNHLRCDLADLLAVLCYDGTPAPE